uniref:J domain-containing protein n=1 Tax=Kalanchoe fedtschenkoi TaxID=63787 RepID=A0A7N1A4Z2_KALFE
MLGDEARLLLGFPPDSHPSYSQIKAAYRKKVWECHPDRVPQHQKPSAESQFKLISEAYNCMLSGGRGANSYSYADSYSRVVRTGVPRSQGGTKYQGLIKVPFLLIIFGTVSLGGFIATRAYNKQKASFPSHNPFLP